MLRVEAERIKEAGMSDEFTAADTAFPSDNSTDKASRAAETIRSASQRVSDAIDYALIFLPGIVVGALTGGLVSGLVVWVGSIVGALLAVLIPTYIPKDLRPERAEGDAVRVAWHRGEKEGVLSYLDSPHARVRALVRVIRHVGIAPIG